MKPIEKHELYENLRHFLKGKGIELTEGSYSKGIHAGCSLLADAINLSQTGIERARNEIEKQVNNVRHVIHEKTAPRKATSAKPPPPQAGADGKAGKKTRKAAGTSRKRGKG
jgi:hypothetical protein